MKKSVKMALMLCGAVVMFVAMTFAAYAYWQYITAM